MSFSVAGRYYDGRSARSSAAELVIADGNVTTVPPLPGTTCGVHELKVEHRLGNLPMTVRFPDGGKFETPESAALDNCLREYGGAHSWLHRLENHTRALVASLVLVVGFIAAGYYLGIPLLSSWLAPRIPPQVEASLGREALEQFDELVFEPTGLTEQRQRELEALFERAKQPFPELAFTTFQLRKGGFISANALALPGGTVVLTDELAMLAANDDQLTAVLLHELGHVNNRHLMRQLINQSGIAVITLLMFGDVSGLGSVLVALPTMLMTSAFSREMELEADDFALAGLEQRGISPAVFGDALARLEGYHTRCRDVLRRARRNDGYPSPSELDLCLRQGGAPDDPQPDSAEDDEDGERWTSYWSTHPGTRERIERIRQNPAP